MHQATRWRKEQKFLRGTSLIDRLLRNKLAMKLSRKQRLLILHALPPTCLLRFPHPLFHRFASHFCLKCANCQLNGAMGNQVAGDKLREDCHCPAVIKNALSDTVVRALIVQGRTREPTPEAGDAKQRGVLKSIFSPVFQLFQPGKIEGEDGKLAPGIFLSLDLVQDKRSSSSHQFQGFSAPAKLMLITIKLYSTVCFHDAKSLQARRLF